MERVILKITDIREPKNVLHRVTQEERFYLQKSIALYGQTRSVIVQKDAQGLWGVVDGWVLLREMSYAGYTEAECAVLPENQDAVVCWAHLNLQNFEVAEENVAENIHKLIKEKGMKYALNNLPVDSDMVAHYNELFEFVWKEFISADKKTQLSIF